MCRAHASETLNVPFVLCFCFVSFRSFFQQRRRKTRSLGTEELCITPPHTHLHHAVLPQPMRAATSGGKQRPLQFARPRAACVEPTVCFQLREALSRLSQGRAVCRLNHCRAHQHACTLHHPRDLPGVGAAQGRGCGLVQVCCACVRMVPACALLGL